jgi:putative membrane protein
MWGGTMIFGWIFWVVIIVALIWFLSYVMTARSRAHGGSNGRPIDILKERFARGEINREEYEERRKTLMNT